MFAARIFRIRGPMLIIKYGIIAPTPPAHAMKIALRTPPIDRDQSTVKTSALSAPLEKLTAFMRGSALEASKSWYRGPSCANSLPAAAPEPESTSHASVRALNPAACRALNASMPGNV